jgi:hypothetical protein
MALWLNNKVYSTHPLYSLHTLAETVLGCIELGTALFMPVDTLARDKSAQESLASSGERLDKSTSINPAHMEIDEAGLERDADCTEDVTNMIGNAEIIKTFTNNVEENAEKMKGHAKIMEESNELRVKCDKLRMESDKMWEESDRLRMESNKMWEESDKLRKSADMVEEGYTLASRCTRLVYLVVVRPTHSGLPHYRYD